MKDEKSHRGECAHKDVDNGNRSSFSCSISSVCNNIVLLFMLWYLMVCSRDLHIQGHTVWKHMGVYTPVTWFSDVNLSEAIVTKGFIALFLFTDILLTSILISILSVAIWILWFPWMMNSSLWVQCLSISFSGWYSVIWTFCNRVFSYSLGFQVYRHC